MNHQIDIQLASETAPPFSEEQLIAWAKMALTALPHPVELTLRCVDANEMTHLNFTYRQLNKTTNVLAFPSEIPKEVQLDYPYLGDVIICPEVLEEEAKAFDKALPAHCAHIIIHGILHLLGFDHIQPEETQKMQHQEIFLLSQLGFANPYLEGENGE